MSDMGLVERADNHEERLKKMEEQLTPKNGKKKKEGKMRVPGNLLSWARKEPNRAVALVIGFNKGILFKRAEAKDGNWYVEGDKYGPHAYEEVSVFHYKKSPIIIVFSWRILTVGGRADEFRTKVDAGNVDVGGLKKDVVGVEEGTRIIGDEKDALLAEAIGIKNFGERTIIRGIEQAEIDKEKKGTGGFGWIIWVIIGLAIVYFASKFFTH